MNEIQLTEALHLATQGLAYTLNDALAEKTDDETFVQDSATFADAGVLTSDSGLVLSLSDGSEFQITVTRTA